MIFLDERESVGLLGSCPRLAWGLDGSAGVDLVLGPGSWSGLAVVAKVRIRVTRRGTRPRTTEVSRCLNRRGVSGPSTIEVLDSAKGVCDDDGSLAHPT